jgi:hypothetical protein
MRKSLIVAMLIYVVSSIALTVCFAFGADDRGIPLWALMWRLFLAVFVWGLCWAWALIPTALYLVYEFIVKRT